MKKIIILLLLIITSNLFSQQCGTHPPTVAEYNYTRDVVSNIQLPQFNTSGGINLTCIPIRPHIVRHSNGTGGISLEEINKGISNLNEYYYDMGLEFFLCGTTPDYIDNSTYYDFISSDETAMAAAGNEVTNAINMYFVNGIDYSGGSTYTAGYAYLPFDNIKSTRVIMRNGSTADGNTLLHEIGHHYNLLHTFAGTIIGNNDPNAENVPRAGINANCSTKGDLLCGTEADPGYNANITNCVYTGTSADINGVTYTPDINNIMSYFPDYCQNPSLFSADQKTRIQQGKVERDGHSSYDMSCTTGSVVNTPTGLSVSFNGLGVNLNWSDNATNELGYFIERSSTSATSGFRNYGGFATNIDSTSFSDVNLTANTTYYYRVKAVNSGCNDYSNVDSVVVGNVICSATGNNGNDEYISRVQLNTIDNVTGSDNYTNYSNIITDLTIGTSYNYTVTNPGNSAGGSNGYPQDTCAIWIDWNKDGDFEDANELITNTGGVGPYVGTITPPVSAASGNTIMRVRIHYNEEASEPCGTTVWGEVEDYGINVVGGCNIDITTTITDTTISANANSLLYQWLDCNNSNIFVIGATNQVFTPTTNGSYAVQITNGSCIDTSACVLFNSLKPVACSTFPDTICLGQVIPLNANCSYHQDVNRIISTYEWDVNNDGIYDSTGVTVDYLNSSALINTVENIKLKITDDLGAIDSFSFNIYYNNGDSIFIDSTSCIPADVGTVVLNLTNKYGCDSIVSTITSLLSSSSNTIIANTCNPLDVGSVMDTIVNSAGCDSIITTITFDSGNDFNLATFNSFTDVYSSTVDFADVNGDGSKDVLITGNSASGKVTKLYINNGFGAYSEKIGTGLVAVENGNCEFADVDGDGDQDLLITGYMGALKNVSNLYLNDGSANFTIAVTPFDSVAYGSVSFSDVDGDGDQDVLISGEKRNPIESISKLYINDGSGVFAYLANSFDGVKFSSVAFADIDNDNDNDIIITGQNNALQKISKLYKNNGSGIFTIVAATPFVGVMYGSVAFGDIDNDNDQDLIICGQETLNRKTRVFTNNGTGVYSLLAGTTIAGTQYGEIALADMNGDNNLDLIVTGRNQIGFHIADLYYNNGSLVFTLDIGNPFNNVLGYFDIADIDNDSDLDILFSGLDDFSSRTTNLYFNSNANISTNDTINNTTCVLPSAGIVIDTFTSVTSCDSIVTTITTYVSAYTSSQNVFGCDSILVLGNMQYSNITILDTLLGQAANGCDSIVTYNVVVNNTVFNTINNTSCLASNVGTVVDTVTSGAANGCDSITTIITTLIPTATNTENINGCDSILVLGNMQYSNTTILDTLQGQASNGCDSIVTYNIVINNTVLNTVNATSCLLSNIGTVKDTIIAGASNGCDSIFTTITTFLSGLTSNQNIVGCDSILVLGTMQYSNATIIDTMLGQASGSCDSIVTYNVIVNNTIFETVNLTSCLTSNIGTTLDTVLAGASTGCDSVTTTITTLLPPATNIQNINGCDSILVLGNMQYLNITILDTLLGQASNGCDSIVTYNVVINNTITITKPLETDCDSVLVNGNYYFTTQTVKDTFTTINGCDSFELTDIVVNQSGSYTYPPISGCDSLLVFGNYYYTTQTVIDTGITVAGCNFYYFKDIAISYSNTVINPSDTACDSIQVNGNYYYTSQTVLDTYLSGNGCTTFEYTDVVINYSSIVINPIDTACDSILVNGNYYFMTQIVQDTFATVNGCDSIEFTAIVINNSIIITNPSDTACDSILVNGNYYFTTQTITDNFTTINGCDSIEISDIVIHNSVIITNPSDTACDSILVNGNYYFMTQIVQDTFATVNGCDSIEFTAIVINNSIIITNPIEIGCDSVLVNGNYYYTTQTVQDTFATINGCDSIEISYIEVNNSIITTNPIDTACDSILVNGNYYFTTQTITDTFTTINGCDSIEISDVVVNYSVIITNPSDTACDSIMVNGNYYYTTQTVTDNFTTVNGCDSIEITDVVIFNTVIDTLNLTTCIAANAGIVIDTVLAGSSNGCDSFAITITTLLPTSTSTQNVFGCDSILISGNMQYTNVTILDTIVAGAINGCDSIVTYNVVINNTAFETVNLSSCIMANVGSVNDTIIAGASSGCDSITTTITTLLPSSSDTVFLTTCLSSNVGTVIVNPLNQYGCDSIFTTITTLLPSSSDTVFLTTCLSSNVGTVIVNPLNQYGCDSITTTITTLSPSITSVSAGVQTSCDAATNTYTQEITLTYINEPTTGNINVNGQIFAVSSSPQTIILTGLIADGLAVDVTALFDLIPGCPITVNGLFIAPSNCFIPTYTITYDVNPVSAGNIIIDGVNTSVFPTSINYFSGTTVNIEVIENTGYSFDFWQATNSTILPNITDGIVSFDVLSNDMIIANFNKIKYDTLWVISNPSNAATLEVGGDIITNTPYMGIYPLNELLDIKAIPNSGAVFNQWNISGEVIPDYNATSFFSYLGQDTLFAYFNNVLAIEEIGSDIEEIKVYPTITNGKLTIEVKSKESTNLKIELLNISGQKIKTLYDNQLNSNYKEIFNLDISQGLYFINFISDDSFVSHKIIKLK